MKLIFIPCQEGSRVYLPLQGDHRVPSARARAGGHLLSGGPGTDPRSRGGRRLRPLPPEYGGPDGLGGKRRTRAGTIDTARAAGRLLEATATAGVLAAPRWPPPLTPVRFSTYLPRNFRWDLPVAT